MSMAVAYWLLKDPEHRYETLEEAMVTFAKNCPCPNGGYGEMFYVWLFMPWSLDEMCPTSYDDVDEPLYESPAGRAPYNSWGNGAAMRVSAVGWFFDTLEETERVAKISAEITHNHPEGIKGAQSAAAAIWMARNGKSKEEIKEYIETKYGYDLSRTWEYLNRTYDWDSSCQGTVPEAIIAFLESNDFEDAIRKAVSMGGDSDTLACITGGIAEAFYKEIPTHMIESTQKPFPPIFHKILDAIKHRTSYGKV
jgi:ADP-ribosylglycohydrolase